MMSPTGSAIAAPPSEPSCYDDRQAEDIRCRPGRPRPPRRRRHGAIVSAVTPPASLGPDALGRSVRGLLKPRELLAVESASALLPLRPRPRELHRRPEYRRSLRST